MQGGKSKGAHLLIGSVGRLAIGRVGNLVGVQLRVVEGGFLVADRYSVGLGARLKQPQQTLKRNAEMTSIARIPIPIPIPIVILGDLDHHGFLAGAAAVVTRHQAGSIAGADARTRTGTGVSPRGILSPMRLPFRHVGPRH